MAVKNEFNIYFFALQKKKKENPPNCFWRSNLFPMGMSVLCYVPQQNLGNQSYNLDHNSDCWGIWLHLEAFL